MNKANQLCFRITPAAECDLNELVASLKNRNSRQWNKSALLNLLIRASKERYMKLTDKKLQALLEQYAEMRGK